MRRSGWHFLGLAFLGTTAIGVGILILATDVIVFCALLLRDTFWGDPTIYLAYAQNIANGHWFEFNPGGGFSSGIASPLWSVFLAIPLALGTGIAGAKVFAAAVTLWGFATTVAAAYSLTRSLVASTIGSLVVVAYLTFHGVMLYDSGMVVGIAALSIVAGLRIVGTPTRRDWVFLALVWMALPIGRIDAGLLLAVELAGLLIYTRYRARLLAIAAIASVPAVLYYGYSQFTLGTYSVSNATRTIDQLDSAAHFGPVLYSPGAIAFLGSVILPLVMTSLGGVVLWRARESRWLAIYVAAVVAAYAVLLVLYPVTTYIDRYFLPATPFMAVAIAALVANGTTVRLARVAIAGVAFLVLLLALQGPIDLAGNQAQYGFTFDETVEREVVDIINAQAPPGAVVMTYEVQARYYLRPDLRLLAINGISDGLIDRYLPTHDILGFMLAERPDYWIVNDRGHRRPYTIGTILDQVGTAFETQPGLQTMTVDGIRFDLVRNRNRPIPGTFAGWRHLLRITYPESAYGSVWRDAGIAHRNLRTSQGWSCKTRFGRKPTT